MLNRCPLCGRPGQPEDGENGRLHCPNCWGIIWQPDSPAAGQASPELPAGDSAVKEFGAQESTAGESTAPSV